MIETASRAPDFTAARRSMIESQLRTSGINDRWVLDRMAAVPREDFVPENARASAYIDRSIPLGGDAVLAPPFAQGQLLTYGQPREDERTLIVGMATGYLAALFGPLVGEVREATPDALLAGKVDTAFDLVVVDGAVEEITAPLAAAIAPEGRIVTGLVDRGITKLALGRPSGDGVSLIPVAETQLPRLRAFDRPQRWTF